VSLPWSDTCISIHTVANVLHFTTFDNKNATFEGHLAASASFPNIRVAHT
jgi:hypothetical protein